MGASSRASPTLCSASPLVIFSDRFNIAHYAQLNRKPLSTGHSRTLNHPAHFQTWPFFSWGHAYNPTFTTD